MTQPPAGAPESAERIFEELGRLAAVSAYARAIYEGFLEHDCIYTTLKVDHSATVDAGHIALSDEPSESLVVCLLAMRVVKAQEDIFFNRAHTITPKMVSAGILELEQCAEFAITSASLVERVFLAMQQHQRVRSP